MSATLHLPAHAWASAHRLLLVVLAVTLAAMIALAITLFTVGADTGGAAIGGSLQNVEDTCADARVGAPC